ncbi:TasA family protein [Metabacillus iocasae]|uniref:Uncharacterized protein n=1 Tax=Priestia iocasae TaxID=2291674 RepID=A0ABS2QYZ0_9BACI|nr:TasA family protein [Metabacillus iocasae]MBM7704711.1 hypothetical protein [Metabacillus iocasae]
MKKKGKIPLIWWAICIALMPMMFFGKTTALFTDEVVVNNNIFSTATLSIEVTPKPIFNVSDIVPGDVIERTVTVENSGTVSFLYDITNTPSVSSLLWTDVTNGLQLEVKQGTTILYNGPISGLNGGFSPIQLNSAQTEVLTLTVTLPQSADNTFQNLTETVTFNFDAVQLTGANR